jgi:hypothetical protein
VPVCAGWHGGAGCERLAAPLVSTLPVPHRVVLLTSGRCFNARVCAHASWVWLHVPAVQSFGHMKVVELKPDGDSLIVTQSNKQGVWPNAPGMCRVLFFWL